MTRPILAFLSARLSMIALALCLALPACNATETGNPNLTDAGADSGPSTDGGGGSQDAGVGCGLDIWTGPDAPRQSYECGRLFRDDHFTCTCDGDEREGGPLASGDAGRTDADCRAAMETICEITPPARQHCEGYGGTCWPADGDDTSWTCQCDGATDATASTGDTCYEALFQHCATPCEDLWGSCVPGEDEASFTCACDYYGASLRTRHTGTCEAALTGCNPTGTGQCASYAGFCDQSVTGFECACVDGTGARATFNELGHDDCERMLEATCTDVAPHPPYACEEAGPPAKSCVRTQGEDGGVGYRCTCSALSPNGASAGGGPLLTVDTCEAALAVTSC